MMDAEYDMSLPIKMYRQHARKDSRCKFIFDHIIATCPFNYILKLERKSKIIYCT